MLFKSSSSNSWQGLKPCKKVRFPAIQHSGGHIFSRVLSLSLSCILSLWPQCTGELGTQASSVSRSETRGKQLGQEKHWGPTVGNPSHQDVQLFTGNLCVGPHKYKHLRSFFLFLFK